MIEVSKLLLLAIGELLLLSLIYAGVVHYLAFSKRQRERAAVKQLVARIQEDSGRRESETRKIMQERFGLSGDDLEAVVRKIAREEKVFYQTLIDVFIRRDTEAIQNLCVDYEGSVDAYRTLQLPSRGETVDGGSEPDADHTEELLLLKSENQRLSTELQLTMDTMSNMLSEYTQMFAGGADVSLDRTKLQEVLTPGEQADPAPPALDDEAGLQDVDAVAEPLSDAADTDRSGGENPEPGDELKALDQELGMRELADEDLAAEASPQAIDLDETVVLSPGQHGEAGAHVDEVIDPGDEVVSLDDVLDDPESKRPSS